MTEVRGILVFIAGISRLSGEIEGEMGGLRIDGWDGKARVLLINGRRMDRESCAFALFTTVLTVLYLFMTRQA